MNLRRVLGLTLTVAAASIALPAVLSAQSDAGADQPQVRIKLLASGDIQVTGEFILERDGPATGPVVRVSGTSVITDASPPMANLDIGGSDVMIQSSSIQGTPSDRPNPELRFHYARIYRRQ